jgi:hypothetical protein
MFELSTSVFEGDLWLFEASRLHKHLVWLGGLDLNQDYVIQSHGAYR